MENMVIVEQEGSVLTICLNRPENLNAFNVEMLDGVGVELIKAQSDSSIRAVVITGKGRAFCSGGDLKFLLEWKGPKNEAFGVLAQKFHEIIMAIRKMPKPIIAAVNGVASGGGFSMAMACDLRIASSDAKFKQAYTSIGLTPDGGWTIFVARQIGFAKASELLLMDPVLDADQALNLGLVNKLVPATEFAEEVIQLAQKASSKSLTAFAKGKAMLNKSLGFGIEDQLETEREGIMNASESSDFAEGVSAFMNKRLPSFIGKV